MRASSGVGRAGRPHRRSRRPVRRTTGAGSGRSAASSRAARRGPTPRRPRGLRTIRSGCTCSPPTSSTDWEAAVSVRRTRSRTVAHSTCQPPSARSSTCEAAATCRVAASCGCGEGGPADEHGQHRVGLAGHRRRAAGQALGELADLGARHHQDVVGDPGQGVGRRDERIAEAGDGRADRVPRDRFEVDVDPELDHGRAGAGGAADLVGEGQCLELLVGVDESREPLGDAEPERRRHGVLGERATDHRGRRDGPRPGR